MSKKATKKNGKGNGSVLTAIYTGDTKNFNKFHIVTEGHVGSIYFPVSEDIENKTIKVKLITPSDLEWEDKIDELIENTSSPKALDNLKKCRNKHVE